MNVREIQLMITLISPYSDITSYPVRILSAYLRGKGLRTRLIFLPELHDVTKPPAVNVDQLYHEKTVEQIIGLCKGSSMIGMSLFSSNFPHASFLTKRIKQKLAVPILWGGKHPSADPEESLEHADMVCLGEGEEALCELAEKIEKGEEYLDTQNIWFRHNGSIIKNPHRPLMEDLDQIPFPDYSFEEHYIRNIETNDMEPLTSEIYKNYVAPAPLAGMPPNTLSYETLFSRGCPYSCSYCYSFRPMYKGQKYLRFRSIENLMQELELMKKKFAYIQMIWFLDDNIFILPIDKLKEFCKQYKERIGLPMSFAGHPLNINEEKLRCLTEAGLKSIQMGVQSGSKRMQIIYRRRMPEKKIHEAAAAINMFKDTLTPTYDFITDSPEETDEDVIESIRLALTLPKPRKIQVFSMMLFPGTELAEKAIAEGKFSSEDKKAVYTQDFGDIKSRKKKYLNCVFPLFNRDVPNFIIEFLINKHVMRLLNRQWIIDRAFNILIGIKNIGKKARAARGVT